MSKPTRPTTGGQESRLTGPAPAGESALVLRLFALHPDPRALDLGQLRRVLDFADRVLEAFRFAAEDAVDAEPLTPPLELFREIHDEGALLAELLTRRARRAGRAGARPRRAGRAVMMTFPSCYDAGQGDDSAPASHPPISAEPRDPFQRFGAQIMAEALFRAQRFADEDPTYRAHRTIANAWREACAARRGEGAAERRLAFLTAVESAIRQKRQRGALTRPAKRKLARYEAQIAALRAALVARSGS